MTVIEAETRERDCTQISEQYKIVLEIEREA